MLCRDTVRTEHAPDVVRICLLEEGHDTDPALMTPHRDGEIAWVRTDEGVRSWLDGARVFS